MALGLDALVIHKSTYDATTVLAPWEARLGKGFTILLPTRLGHVFLEATDGAIWFLDTWFGDLVKVCDTYDEFRKRVHDDSAFILERLMPDLVDDLLAAGMRADTGDCYSPFVSPLIGGGYSTDNFHVVSLRVHLATSAAEYRAIHGL